jgi:hypothetical protein
MGSYAAFSLLGMYPLPATRQLLISSPYFPVVEFVNPVYNTTTTFKTSGSGLFVKVCFLSIFGLRTVETDIPIYNGRV